MLKLLQTNCRLNFCLITAHKEVEIEMWACSPYAPIPQSQRNQFQQNLRVPATLAMNTNNNLWGFVCVQNVGFTTPLPTVALGLTAVVGLFTAFGVFRSDRRDWFSWDHATRLVSIISQCVNPLSSRAPKHNSKHRHKYMTRMREREREREREMCVCVFQQLQFSTETSSI
jgi:hypothetical protein